MPVSVVIRKIVDVLPSDFESRGLTRQLSGVDGVKIEHAMDAVGVESRLFWGRRDSDPLTTCEDACRLAFEGYHADDIGMVFFSTINYTRPPFRLIPNPASDLRVRLGLRRAGTLSGLGGCTSWAAMLCSAVDFVSMHNTSALVVTHETTRDFTRSGVPRAIFGDACVALLLTPSEEEGRGFVAVSNSIGYCSDEYCRLDSEMNAALTIDEWGIAKRSGTLWMRGEPVARFVRQQVMKRIVEFCDDQSLDPADINVFIPHQANISLMTELKQALFPHAFMPTTITTRGNNGGASAAVALRDALAKHSEFSKRFFLCAFGSGPNIVCCLYVSTGQEKALQVTSRAPVLQPPTVNRLNTTERNEKHWPVPASRNRLFSLLFPEDYESAQGGTHKIVVESREEIDTAAWLLGDSCELVASDETRLRRLGVHEWTPKLDSGRPDAAQPEVIDRMLSRIPAENALTEGCGIQFAPTDPVPPPIVKALVHKKSTGNVLLSEPSKCGNLWYFNLFVRSNELQFDHESDHVQGMLILEGFRQAGIAFCCLTGAPPQHSITVTGLRANFHCFVETTVPIQLRVAGSGWSEKVAHSQGDEHSAAKVRVWAIVQLLQAGRLCASSNLEGVVTPAQSYEQLRRQVRGRDV